MSAEYPTARMLRAYDRYHVTLWRAWCALQDWRPNAWAWDPNARPVEWDRWHRISTRGSREWDRAEHATHGTLFPDFRPLWCDYCQKGTPE